MSVLNQSGEEQVECPLCMEPLEVDDLNFFPCTCGYQICRFCWHRIRTDENGLCPACRKGYPENPADFKPLSQEEVAKLKADKRHKDQQRKQKITENRKHLANVRVVQRNLVFVVGLPMRLADSEVLKKHEYFGKFGKIHKVVINQCTSYAGTQGPSASAYVTYQRADDALRAIQAVNNILVDGRSIKSSLGTTKYCSHFMKNQACPKPDCMYLHDQGDSEASFTKEDMQQGKHQEYEKKLHDALISASSRERKPTPSPPALAPAVTAPCIAAPITGKEAWPSLQPGLVNTTNGNAGGKSENTRKQSNAKMPALIKKRHSSEDDDRGKSLDKNSLSDADVLSDVNDDSTPSETPSSASESAESDESAARHDVKSLLATRLFEPDNNSFFSSNSFSKVASQQSQGPGAEWQTQTHTMPDIMMPTVHPAEDWEAAFGFSAAPAVSDMEADNPGAVFTSLHSQLAQQDAGFGSNRLGFGPPNQRLSNGSSKFFSQYHRPSLDPPLAQDRAFVDTSQPPLQSGYLDQQSKYLEQHTNYLEQPPTYLEQQQPQSKYLEQPPPKYHDLQQTQSKYLEQPQSKYLEQTPQSKYLEQQPQSKYLEQSQSKYLEQPQSKYLEQTQSKYLEQQPQSKYLEQSQSKYHDLQQTPKYVEQHRTKYIELAKYGMDDPCGYRDGYGNARYSNGAARLHNGDADEGEYRKTQETGAFQRKLVDDGIGEGEGGTDDWGFDLFHETQKALAELMEKESAPRQQQQYPHAFHAQHFQHPPPVVHKAPDYSPMQRSGAPSSGCSRLLDGLGLGANPVRTRLPPPGFTTAPNHMNSFGLGIPRPAHNTASKILPFLSRNNNGASSNGSLSPQPAPAMYRPTVNGTSSQHFGHRDWFTEPAPTQTTNNTSKGWTGPCTDWTALDPAIVSSSRPSPLHHPPPPAPWLRHLDERATITGSTAFFGGAQDWSAPPPGFSARQGGAGAGADINKLETESTFLCF